MGDKVCNPKFDNGADDGGFASMLATMGKKEVNVDSREKFINELGKAIEIELESKDKEGRYPRLILDVDYNPCLILYACADTAGISKNNFPWKTTMWIEKDCVSVRYGYRAPMEYLYSNKEYWLKRIEDTEEQIKEYEKEDYFSWINDKDEKEKRKEGSIQHCKDCIIKFKEELEKVS